MLVVIGRSELGSSEVGCNEVRGVGSTYIISDDITPDTRTRNYVQPVRCAPGYGGSDYTSIWWTRNLWFLLPWV